MARLTRWVKSFQLTRPPTQQPVPKHVYIQLQYPLLLQHQHSQEKEDTDSQVFQKGRNSGNDSETRKWWSRRSGSSYSPRLGEILKVSDTKGCGRWSGENGSHRSACPTAAIGSGSGLTTRPWRRSGPSTQPRSASEGAPPGSSPEIPGGPLIHHEIQMTAASLPTRALPRSVPLWEFSPPTVSEDPSGASWALSDSGRISPDSPSHSISVGSCPMNSVGGTLMDFLMESPPESCKPLDYGKFPGFDDPVDDYHHHTIPITEFGEGKLDDLSGQDFFLWNYQNEHCPLDGYFLSGLWGWTGILCVHCSFPDNWNDHYGVVVTYGNLKTINMYFDVQSYPADKLMWS